MKYHVRLSEKGNSSEGPISKNTKYVLRVAENMDGEKIRQHNVPQ